MRSTPSSIRSLLVALPTLFVAAGCEDSVAGPPAGDDLTLEPGHAAVATETDVHLRTEAGALEPGGTVTLFLDNESGEQVGFNLCFHAIERRSGEDWTMLPDGRICTTQLHLLDSGGTAQYEATIPEDLEAGEYRFRVSVHLMESEVHRDLVSGGFMVEG